MLGRLLFAFVWLIIAAGLVLPLYPHPHDAATSAVAAADPVRLVASTDPAGCTDCALADRAIDCAADCPCDRVVPAAFVPLDEGASVTCAVSVRPRAGHVPAKLPAI